MFKIFSSVCFAGAWGPDLDGSGTLRLRYYPDVRGGIIEV
jgi:hypothetical protein